jgi:hypothetical protein
MAPYLPGAVRSETRISEARMDDGSNEFPGYALVVPGTHRLKRDGIVVIALWIIF